MNKIDNIGIIKRLIEVSGKPNDRQLSLMYYLLKMYL